MKLPLVIIGAGDHAAVLADALLAAAERVLGFAGAEIVQRAARGYAAGEPIDP